jgi:hypothetical protein
MDRMRFCIAALCLVSLARAESVAGVKWTAPAGWKSEGPRPMRAATYLIAPAAGDHDTAECAVYFFGQGQGGGIEDNIARWQGQFKGAKTAGAPRERTVHGLKVTTLDISGEYTGMGGPMAPQASSKPGYRLLGAIVQAPGGNLFVKFTGPAATIASNQAKFEQLLNSFEKQ